MDNIERANLYCGNCKTGDLKLVNEGQEYVCKNSECKQRFDVDSLDKYSMPPY